MSTYNTALLSCANQIQDDWNNIFTEPEIFPSVKDDILNYYASRITYCYSKKCLDEEKLYHEFTDESIKNTIYDNMIVNFLMKIHDHDCYEELIELISSK
jgi:hypothetical protein